MATYSQFEKWIERASIWFVDVGIEEPLSSTAPGRMALSDDVRHVRDLNKSKDKKRCMIWHDGQHVRTIDGITKLKQDEDQMAWEFQDKYGTPYRISVWWTKEHKKMRQAFVEGRQPLHAKAVSRMAYMYQGKMPAAAINTPVAYWSEEDAP